MKFVGPINSAQVHCLQKTGSIVAFEKKKRKTREIENATVDNFYPNALLVNDMFVSFF